MSDTDLTFAWEGASGPFGPWQHLHIAELRGEDAISSLYRYEITTLLREPAPELDPDDLIQSRATLRIVTLTEPRCRVVHGVITEAEELGQVQNGTLYRLVLSPPLARAMHRTRCRIFLEKTTRQIIDTVLQGDPQLKRADGAVAPPDNGEDGGFTPAEELFAWRVADTSRIDQVAARPYCVQYNESDFAFVSRLLEEEGIGYHFENGGGICLLVLSDNDAGRTRLAPFTPLGPTTEGRIASAMKLGARLRPHKVTLLDYNWKKPVLDMGVEEQGPRGSKDLVDHEYPGRYPDTPAQGKPLAAAKLGRLEVEASYAVGEGSCRLLSAGSIFALESTRPSHDGEYLVTKLTVRGEQLGVAQETAGAPSTSSTPSTSVAPRIPYTCTFECARRGKGGGAATESRYRPARVTPKPRIQGSQTAFVTASPSAAGAEIHVGGPPDADVGCVRVRFHWDKDTARHGQEPTSCWVRVSQVFAGAGEGAVFHPRVGVEVIVDFEEGDPDRPIVVGRVYNGQNLPPAGAPTVSTFKTMTSPGGGSYNELTFDDTAGNQQIKLHTPKDWNSEVGNNRSETVAVDSSSSVGVNRSEATGVDRSTMVGTNNTEIVGANEVITVGADQIIMIGANQSTAIAENQSLSVGVNQSAVIEKNQSLSVGVDQGVLIGGNRSVAVVKDAKETIGGSRVTAVVGQDFLSVKGQQAIVVEGAQMSAFKAGHQLAVTGNDTTIVDGDQFTNVTGAQQETVTKSQNFYAGSQQLSAEGSQLMTSKTFDVEASEAAAVNTKSLTLNGVVVVRLVGGKLVINMDSDIEIQGKNITLTGEKIDLKAKRISIQSETDIDIKGALIKLN